MRAKFWISGLLLTAICTAAHPSEECFEHEIYAAKEGYWVVPPIPPLFYTVPGSTKDALAARVGFGWRIENTCDSSIKVRYCIGFRRLEFGFPRYKYKEWIYGKTREMTIPPREDGYVKVLYSGRGKWPVLYYEHVMGELTEDDGRQYFVQSVDMLYSVFDSELTSESKGVYSTRGVQALNYMAENASPLSRQGFSRCNQRVLPQSMRVQLGNTDTSLDFPSVGDPKDPHWTLQ